MTVHFSQAGLPNNLTSTKGWGWHMLWNFNMFSHLNPPASRQPSTWTPRWTRPSGRKKHIFRRKVHGFKRGRNMCPWNKFQKQPRKLLRLARRNMWWKKHYLKYVPCRYARKIVHTWKIQFCQDSKHLQISEYILRIEIESLQRIMFTRIVFMLLGNPPFNRGFISWI